MLFYIIIILLIADLVLLVLATGSYVATRNKYSHYKSTNDLMCEKGLIFCWSGLFRDIANVVRRIFKKEKLPAEEYVTEQGSVLLRRIQWIQAVAALLALVLMFCLQLVLENHQP